MSPAKPEPIPPDLFLSGYAPEIRKIAERLRAVVHDAVPESIERVRTGWRLIGYDVSVDRRMRYFAFVAPEPEHVHLGFEYGICCRIPTSFFTGRTWIFARCGTSPPTGRADRTEALVRYAGEAAAIAVARLSAVPGQRHVR